MRAGAGDLSQKLAPWNIIVTNNRNRIQRTLSRSFFVQPYRMAEGAAGTRMAATRPIESKLDVENDKKEKPSQNTPKEIPPPPEKPLPGDCCGSGCVRCVWDVYYEELEEYNKLSKQDPNPKS